MHDDREFSDRIKAECMHGDWEGAHADADIILIELLRKLGYNQTADAWLEVGKWYS